MSRPTDSPSKLPVDNPDPAPFQPAWWLRGGHAQTLWGSLCRPSPKPALTRQRLELADGDFLDLDWSASAADVLRPLVLILHGLEGSSRSSYVRALVQQLEEREMAAVLMHFRGCSEAPNRLERTYHSGESGDIAMISRWLRKHWPRRSIAAAGFSLGGNALLKHLGEQPEAVVLQAAAVACVPMDLALCASRMERGLSRLYLRRLVGQLKAKVAAKYRHRPCSLDLSAVARCRGFWEFDELVTAPLHGFHSAGDYYRRSSSCSYVAGIRIPTLIVHARDDPFMSDEVLPRSVPPLPACVRLEVTDGGGHVGFVEGTGPLGLVPRGWLERRIAAYLVDALANQ